MKQPISLNFSAGINPENIRRLFVTLKYLIIHTKSILFLLMIVSCSLNPLYSQSDNILESIQVSNKGGREAPRTKFQTGPAVGDMLNVHFYPGLEDFRRGNYSYALVQMNYVIDRPHYLEDNPNQAQFMSTAYYVRGVIYLDHAEGIGRMRLALNNFRAALKWQPDNLPAQLGIARIYKATGENKKAIEVLESMLLKDLPTSLETEVRNLLKDLTDQQN